MSGSIKKLNQVEFLADVKRYIELCDNAREAAAAAAAATEARNAQRHKLLQAMNGASAAQCGNYILTVKETRASAASITLADSRKVKWDAVTCLLIGNETVKATDVVSLYGGRAASLSLDVAGG
jgi:hypothetical protein